MKLGQKLIKIDNIQFYYQSGRFVDESYTEANGSVRRYGSFYKTATITDGDRKIPTKLTFKNAQLGIIVKKGYPINRSDPRVTTKGLVI